MSRSEQIELNEKNLNKYREYWTKNFAEGPQKIYYVTGNTDSSDRNTSLCINLLDDCYFYKKHQEPHKFNNWQEVAHYIAKNGSKNGDYFGIQDDSDDDLEDDNNDDNNDNENDNNEDEDNEDEDNNTDKKLSKIDKKLSKIAELDEWKLFSMIVNSNRLDPFMFVTENNPLLFWLKEIRGF